MLSKTFFCCDEHICLSKNKQKKTKNKAKKTKEEQTRDKKKHKKSKARETTSNKDLKVLSSEEGRAGHLISSLSVLKVVISSNDDAQPVVCDRKEEKAEGERKRRRC